MSVSTASIEQLTINTIRTLSMDAVQKANSGHPGTPMALAPVAYTLWRDYLRYDPEHPHWPNRDRFVLSCGHASMLLYSLLHLAGVKQLDASGSPTGEEAVTLDQIKHFRQLHSRTPGHPEHGDTTGVETTTGPLGQGCGNSVGMAIAQRWLAARYNKPDVELFDYNIYAFASDGDFMEGISCEAASLAGHLRLSNLCWVYDDNHITIEGNTSLAFDEDVPRRFEGLGWHVVKIGDANDLEAIRAAFDSFLQTDDKPTLIVLRSQIAFGSPNKQNTSAAHGSALGEDEVRATKANYGWPEDEHFLVPEGVIEHFRSALASRGGKQREACEANFAAYEKAHPKLAQDLRQMQAGALPEGWDEAIPEFPTDAKGMATRSASGKVLQTVAQRIDWLIGGSADLAPSTNTLLTFDGAESFSAQSYGGRNLHFGVREHAMGAALNGMALSNLRPYGATFLVFSDYLRPAFRLAAIMGLPSLFVFTHDSIGLGEDGPTHQPVEHLAALRAIPNSLVVRPADANEVAEAYRTVLPITNRPTALVLTRQSLPTLDRAKYASAAGLARGAYVLADSPNPRVILMASGSEVSLCLAACEQLLAEGIATRVVSMPCWELFDEQDASYRESVLPASVTARVGVEAAVSLGWDRYLGPGGQFVGMHGFGASAPLADVMKNFGFTVENVVATAKATLARG